jgi:hypothetical protein
VAARADLDERETPSFAGSNRWALSGEPNRTAVAFSRSTTNVGRDEGWDPDGSAGGAAPSLPEKKKASSRRAASSGSAL